MKKNVVKVNLQLSNLNELRELSETLAKQVDDIQETIRKIDYFEFEFSALQEDEEKWKLHQS